MRRDPNAFFTIGQLAKAAGVPTSTLRFYERSGLLKPIARAGNNYRSYDRASLSRLRFIRIAQAAGLSLDDVANLICLIDQRSSRCPEVQSVLKERLAAIDQRLSELKAVKSAVESALHACRCSPRGGLCLEIEEMARAGKIPLDLAPKCMA